jgi:hypothetical protein
LVKETSRKDGSPKSYEPPYKGVSEQTEHIHRGRRILQKRDKEGKKRICAIDSTGFSIKRFVSEMA